MFRFSSIALSLRPIFHLRKSGVRHHSAHIIVFRFIVIISPGSFYAEFQIIYLGKAVNLGHKRRLFLKEY